MAENVERAMESITEELEEMKRTKLFNDSEVREVIAKMRTMEYRINSISKSLDDFQDYIEFLNVLLRDISSRRDKMKVADKKSSLEHKIIQKVMRLYDVCMERYSHDYNMSMAYFKFCEWYNYSHTATIIIEKLLLAFSHKPEVWKLATEWYMKRDPNMAFSTLHKGLSNHKGNQMLYTEAIKLALADATPNKEALQIKKIEIYVKEIFENVKDIHYLIKILSILKLHEFTTNLQDSIILWLLQHNANEVTVWDMLAHREKEGFHYGISKDLILNDFEFRLQRCAEKYEEGFKSVNQRDKQALWNLYVDCFINEWEEGFKNGTPYLKAKELALEAFHEAEKNYRLPEKYYVALAKLLGESDETIDLIDRGLKRYPQSVDLWRAKIRFPMRDRDDEQFKKIFIESLAALKDEAVPLWMLALRYYTLTGNEHIVRRVFQDGLKQSKPVADVMKAEYIQWLLLVEDATSARKTYNLLAAQEPYSEKLHQVMLKYELLNVNIDGEVEHLLNVYKLLCKQFGHTCCDHYINLLNFYMQFKQDMIAMNPNFDLEKEINDIIKEAELKFKDNDLVLVQFRERVENIMNPVRYQKVEAMDVPIVEIED